MVVPIFDGLLVGRVKEKKSNFAAIGSIMSESTEAGNCKMCPGGTGTCAEEMI